MKEPSCSVEAVIGHVVGRESAVAWRPFAAFAVAGGWSVEAVVAVRGFVGSAVVVPLDVVAELVELAAVVALVVAAAFALHPGSSIASVAMPFTTSQR